MIAVKLLEEQGVEVLAVNFVTNFFGKKEKLEKAARDNNIKLKIVDVSRGYLEKVVKRPKHNRGKNMNPCIDCKIFMMREAHKIMKKEKARFIFTGEVLGQRPMSQKNTPLNIIKKESGLGDKLLRPLSAKLLKRSEAEDKGWVRREKLLDIEGRNRKRQFELARKYRLTGYGSPAGGCLLTEDKYSRKLKDLLDHKKKAGIDDVALLKIGRHFRIGNSKVIVGRHQEDNDNILKLKKRSDIIFQASVVVGPTTLLKGPKTNEVVRAAACLTARYSDSSNECTTIKYGRKLEKETEVCKKDFSIFQNKMIT